MEHETDAVTTVLVQQVEVECMSHMGDVEGMLTRITQYSTW
jgi:hypothetical protein